MEERQTTLSPWVAEVRARVAASPEFRALSQKLFIEVRDGMRRSADSKTLATLPFGELSVEEQVARVHEARDELLTSREFATCREAAWRAIDAALDAESEAVLMRAPAAAEPPLRPNPVAPSTRLAAALTPAVSVSRGGKVGAVIELAGIGAAQLLSRWPVDSELSWEERSLAWLINSELPTPLRRALWRIRLRARAARQRFAAKLAESPLAIISPRDAEILGQCQVALQTADPSQLPALSRMRGCASYVDSTDTIRFVLEQRALATHADEETVTAGLLPPPGSGLPRKPSPPREVFWLVALLRVLPAAECSSAELVERYMALMAMPKPHLPAADGQAVVAAAGVRSGAVLLALDLVAAKDAALAKHVERAAGGAGPARLLTRDHSSRLGVGLFSPAAIAFVWDVGILAGWEQVEACIAAAILLLRDGLLACAKPEALRAYLEATVPQLTVPQLRAALERHFMPDLRRKLRAPPLEDILPLEPSDLVS